MEIDKTSSREPPTWMTWPGSPGNAQAPGPQSNTRAAVVPVPSGTEHRAEWVRSRAEALGRLLEEKGIDEDATVSLIREHYASRMRRRLVWIGLPVIVTLALIGLIALRLISTSQMSWVSHSTAVGEVLSVTLVDGSRIRLDTDSSVRTRFSPGRRDLVLERGQALFEVRPDWLRDFYVTVNQRVERAAGTKFIVTRKDAAESETLVTEGRIEVSNKKAASTGAAAPTTVAAGQIVEIGPKGIHVEKIAAAEVERRLAWIDGKLEFQQTLEEAVAAFNRYNQRKLVIDDVSLHQVPVKGRFNARQPDLFAKALQASYLIDYVPIGPAGSERGEIHLKVRSEAHGSPAQERSGTLSEAK